MTRSSRSRGALPGRLLAPVAHRRVALQLRAQPFHPGLGRNRQCLQPLAATKRAGSRCRPHPHPVLRQHIERHQAFGHQGGNALSQQPLEHTTMRRAKIRQRVVVHRHSAAQPAVGQMLLAQFVQLAGAANPVHRRPQPQRQHQLRRRRRLPRHPLTRLHRLMQVAQVEPPDKGPDRPHRMIACHQIIKRCNLPPRLVSLRLAQPRHPATRRRRCRLIRQSPEQTLRPRHPVPPDDPQHNLCPTPPIPQNP